jgi:hypothetical protein
VNRLRQILVLVLLGGCVWLAGELALASRAARGALEQSRAALAEAQERLAHTSQNANGVLIQLGLAADQWAGASREQRTYWRRTAAETQAAMQELRLAAGQMNQELLPRLAAFLDANDSRLDLLAGEAVFALRQSTDNLEPVLEGLARAASAAADRMNDPALAETVEQTRIAATHLAASSAHVEQATSDLAQAIHRVTRPVSWLKRAGLFVLDTGAKLRLILGR